MKKYSVTLFILLSVLCLNFEMDACGLLNLKQENCCVKFKVDVSEFSIYIINISDGTTYNHNDSPNHIFEHCFLEAGNYQIRIKYSNSDGDLTCFKSYPISVTQDDIDRCDQEMEPCLSYLCWEEFIVGYDCVNSVLLKLPDDGEVLIEFSTINEGDLSDAWCTQGVTYPISINVDVTGGYCEIGLQLIKAINSVGYEVEISESGHVDCLKGSTASIPGYFITSEVKVVRVYGDNCNGQDEKFSVFQHLNCF